MKTSIELTCGSGDGGGAPSSSALGSDPLERHARWPCARAPPRPARNHVRQPHSCTYPLIKLPRYRMKTATTRDPRVPIRLSASKLSTSGHCARALCRRDERDITEPQCIPWEIRHVYVRIELPRASTPLEPTALYDAAQAHGGRTAGPAIVHLSR
ncbi:hypothetical protein EVAR_12074_1 [Eumeta japonica]|uniref:Uncharacterized protein n=1 Tax=Eumeta variegata TaxID=151549 RepID=A0A4C1U509_EUMVA|nr:hypothetical protein EVAR_12074_1 [Eumeta japonica]